MATVSSPAHVDLPSNTNATTSPATVSSLGDGFSANSRFIELQKELRFVLSAGVNSLAPSRAASPRQDNQQEGLLDRVGSYDAQLSTTHFVHQQVNNVLATSTSSTSSSILESMFPY